MPFQESLHGSVGQLSPRQVGRLARFGGSSQLGYVVNIHGDRKSRKNRVVGPLSKWPFFDL